MNKQLQDIFGKILLSKSHIKSQYSISREHFEQGSINWDEYITPYINKGLLEEINKVTDPPKKEELHNEIIYSKELYAFNPKYFHEIINTIIRMMSEEQINKIRSDE